MNEFFNSKLITDMKNGKFPTIEVSISNETLITAAVGIFLAIVAAMIFSKILAKF